MYNEQSIEILEGLEAVRKRPGMYIGDTSTSGLHHLVYEIVDNSIDESVAGYCSEIYVSINKDNSITVRDNGRGMPTGIHPKTGKSTVETILTVLHAGGKFNNESYKTSGGLHGVGSSVVNALSSHLEVIIKRDNKVYKQEYSKGKPLYDLKVVAPCNSTGTEITFTADKEIFHSINFNYGTLEARLRELSYLNNNIKIHLEDKRENKEQSQLFHTTEGLAGYIKHINKNNITLNNNICSINKATSDFQFELAFQYINEDSESIYSFANNINTKEGGVHLNAFRNALKNAVTQFGRDGGILKTDTLTRDDVTSGIVGIISVKVSDPQFEGQTKTKLGNEELKSPLEQLLYDSLYIYFKENTEYGKLLIENAQEAKNLRLAAKKAKDIAKKAKEKKSQGISGKLANCSSKNPAECELFIVEGESAGGSAKQGRDKRTQAILAQKGKSLNVEKTNKSKVVDSDELMTLVNAIGTDMGKDFDIDKLRYNKIIIMTDADVDGKHIVTLLLNFFYRYTKPLLTNGHIYLAQPPLYKNSIANKVTYTYSEDEQKEFLNANSTKKVEIQRYKGLGEMSAEQLWDTTMNPETRNLTQIDIEDDISANYACNMLMGTNVEARRDFIIQNARFIENIDI